MAALEYATPRDTARPVPSFAAKVLGWASMIIFGIVLICFVVGVAGMCFDPSVKEQWGRLHYLFLMFLPTVLLCPIGAIVGLVGMIKGSHPATLGFFLNGIPFLLFLVWRLH